MTFATKTLAATLAVVATVAVAAEGVQDPNVKARQELMKTIGASVGVLGGMATDRAPFDAAAAATAREALAAASAQIVAKFETEADDPKSEGTPMIWMAFDDFTTKATALETAAGALDVASLDALKAGFGAVGGTCRDCHTEYRAKR